jgi:hypothetical protein
LLPTSVDDPILEYHVEFAGEVLETVHAAFEVAHLLEIEIEIVYNMNRAKPVAVSAPPLVCAVNGLILT